MRALLSHRAAAVIGVVSLALAAATPASGQSSTTVPPGNSAINEYLESIPTAQGGRPTNRVHPSGHPRSGAGVSGAGPTGGGGGGGAGAGGTGTGISQSTSRLLAADGPNGIAAAALARATAPGQAVRGSAPPASGGASTGPLSSVLSALTGSASGSGLGALLPVILIVCLLGGGALALVRRRRTSS